VNFALLAEPPKEQRKPIQMRLDCATKTTRLMSWSERKTAAAEWRGSAVPAKAET